jgi:hypothetical protein
MAVKTRVNFLTEGWMIDIISDPISSFVGRTNPRWLAREHVLALVWSS